jgi:signal transduction histidine kinase
MNERPAVSLYRDLQSYLDWDEADRRCVQACGELLAPSFPAIVQDFYERIDRHPEAAKVLTGGTAQRERLKATLLQWIADLFCGWYDEAYVDRHWRAGLRHAEIGLDLPYSTVAMGRIRANLLARLHRASEEAPEKLEARARAIHKLLDLELAIIGDAYQRESLARQRRIERLATLGQIAGGVAHEIRNPLNVIKTSVYYLRQSPSCTPEKREEHFTRIERNIEVADGVVSALYGFARQSAPQARRFQVGATLIELLAQTPPPAAVEVTTSGLDDLPDALADESQIRIAFQNLIRNAYEAMPNGGPLRIAARALDGAVEVSFTDAGPGIPAEQLRKITEPLFTTKARGLGLGLALSRSILEKNRAQLQVASEPGRGTTFTVRLPVAASPGQAQN